MSDKLVDSYILATRGKQVDTFVSEILKKRYRETFEWVVDDAQKMLQPAKLQPIFLRVVHTHQAHVETVLAPTGAYIIYDQFGGQVFNQLTRLQHEQATSDQVDTYLYKLWAVLLLTAGRPREAIQYSGIYHLRYERDSLTNNPKSIFRLSLLTVEEIFMIAHEIAHLVYDYQLDSRLGFRMTYERSLYLARSHQLRNQAAGDEDLNRARLVNEVVESWKESCIRNFDAEPSIENIEYFRERTRAQITEAAAEDRGMVQRLLRDERLSEECICDMLAEDWTMRYWKHLGGNSDIAVLDCAQAMHNLRTLQIIESQMATGGRMNPHGSMTMVSDQFRSFRLISKALLVRQNLGIPHLGHVGDVSGNDFLVHTEEVDGQNHAISDLNRSYWATVGDQVVEFFPAYSKAEISALQKTKSWSSLIPKLTSKDAEMVARIYCHLNV